MSLQYEIETPSTQVFRRAAIQRRVAATGLFNGVWRDISTLVKRWGTLRSGIDSVRFNNFQHSGLNLVVNNDTGEFNHHSNPSSIWFGFMPRYRSLVRIQAGYFDTNTTGEFPSDATLGIYVLDSEISIRSDNNDVTLRCSSLKSIFDEVRARDIAGLTTTLTASNIITTIRDHTDGSANFVFRQFITSTAWTINATTQNYLFTTTVLENLTAWEVMEKLAEAEGFVLLINRTGGIEFRNRAARQSVSQFDFRGQHYARPTVIAITDNKEAMDKYYNYYRLKYLEPDTSTSFVTSGTTTTVNQSNTSWIWGSRVYEFENRFPQNTATAQSIVDSLFSLSSSIPTEMTLKTLFVPQLEVLDRVNISFRSVDLAVTTLWDAFNWAPATGDGARWAREGLNFDMNERPHYITEKKVDLDNFTSDFKVREI